MHDLLEADKIFKELMEEDSNFAKNLIMKWRAEMPSEYAKTMVEEKYGKHIISDELAQTALSFIRNNKGEDISLWSKDEVLKIAKDYISIDDADFYPNDIYVWANVKKGDYGSFISDASRIIRIAIADLTDTSDFPFFDASETAYRWTQCNIQKHDEEMETEE